MKLRSKFPGLGKYIVGIIFIFFFSTYGYAQLDKEFWFVAPAVSVLHSAESTCNCDATLHNNNRCGASPASLNVTNFDSLETIVEIEQPANKYDATLNPTGFVTIIDTIPPQTTKRIVLWENDVCNAANAAMRKLVENRIDPSNPQTVLKKGLHITANNYVTVYYEVEEQNNTDVYALKGSNALGSDFFCSFQTNKANQNLTSDPARELEEARSVIDIVAVDPGITEIEVYPTNPVLGWGSSPFLVTLHQGESISLVAGYVNASSVYVFNQAANLRLAGTKLHARNGKRIAVTLSDDSVFGDTGGCYDLFGDQTIPVEAIRDDGTLKPVIGQDYIVMEGHLAATYDRVYILATQNGTNVSVTDLTTMVVTNYTGMTSGQQVNHRMDHNVYIHSDDPAKPIYVFHTTGGGNGCEVGGAILPTISLCTGSFEVGFSRGATPTGGAYGGYSKEFLLNIMVREENDDDSARYAFTLYDDGVAVPIDGDLFTKVPGTIWWAAQIPFYNCQPSSSNILINTKNIFHLGTLNGGSSNGGNYGYFSDFATVEAKSIVAGTNAPGAKICFGEEVTLIAYGGSNYEWIPGTYLDNRFLQRPICRPREDIKYRVVVSGASCEPPDTAEVQVLVSDSLVTNFELDAYDICAPDSITFLNYSYNSQKNYWYFDSNPTPTILSDNSSIRRYYTNSSDTPQVHTVKLTTINRFCSLPLTKEFIVYPELDADFSPDDTSGCHPFGIQFNNLSTGSIDTSRFYWNFGDNNTSYFMNPLHLYKNISNDDTTFQVTLVATSPYVCRDTIRKNITVYPYVLGEFSIDSSLSCSPISVQINPQGSVGVDTFLWHYYDPLFSVIDSNVIRHNKLPFNFYHADTTQPNPDTINIALIAVNRFGCRDTAEVRTIIVYPEVISDFQFAPADVCDSTSISFLNNSKGYNLEYLWQFGNGNSSALENPSSIYFNRGDSDTTLYITLKATSDFFCVDTKRDSIIVHPYVNANFGLDFENNCTPILATFSNLSIRGHDFEWDFGDGTNSTTSATPFTHQYWNDDPDNDTTYTIQLVALNNEGCSDTVSRFLNIFPHVVAAFDISDSVGCSPLNVAFTNSSTGGVLAYLWDFGNGTSSTNHSPIPRTYTNYTDNDTSYVITLTAINPYGCDSTTYDTVDVYAFIDASINLPLADSCSPFILHPDNLSSPGAHIYEWDLINSGLPTDYNFIPDFGTLSNTGIITDTLYLRLIAYGANDPEHLACADRDSVMVLVFPELDVGFTLNDGLTSCQPYISTITNNTNIPSGNTFQWFIDDTYYSSARDPLPLNIPNYEDTDVDHVIRLSGQSMHGCRDTAWQTITVYSLVDARFTVNKSGICSADSFEIDRRTSRGGIIEYEWNFAGDVQIRDDSIFSYSFENTSSSVPVSKLITLTVRNSHDCTSDISRTLNVYPEVRANFAIDDSTVCYPHPTTFTNSTDNASIYSWDFGDGSGSNNATPVPHEFANYDNTVDETYTINMVARSQYNCYDSIQHGITVYAKPEAEFYFPVSVDCPPFEASMVNESEGFSLTYLWDFNDGTTSLLEDPEHTFSNPGSTIIDIPITLIVTSGRSCMDTVVRVLNVYPDVVVDFTTSENVGCSPLAVNFNGQTTNVSNMIWYIDGLAFSTLEDPSYRFVNNTPGTRDYDVTFSAYSIYGCGDDTTKTITVYSSPTAEFIPDPIIQDYNTEDDQTLVAFFNETLFQDNWNYYWDFGDGNSSDNSDASFNYIYGDHFWGPVDDEGRIPVYLIAWNDEYPECRDTVQYDIFIKAPLPEIALEDDISGCAPFTVNFAATVDYAYEDDFEWDFGISGETSTEQEPSYTFAEPNVYTVKLIVRGDGGTNWDYRIITVNPKPNIDFTFNDSVVFVQSQTHPDEIINFYNLTTFGQDYYWGFNLPAYDYNEIPGYVDTATVAYSHDKNPTWYYNERGMYYVFLIAESDQGCLDTLISPVPINVLGEGRLQFPTGFFVDPTAPRDGYVSDPRDPDVNIFRAYGEGVEQFKLEVYNRWGVLVFDSDDINFGWNGYIDGKPAKQDVYVWRARGRFTNGESFVMSGDVTLIIGDPY